MRRMARRLRRHACVSFLSRRCQIFPSTSMKNSLLILNIIRNTRSSNWSISATANLRLYYVESSSNRVASPFFCGLSFFFFWRNIKNKILHGQTFFLADPRLLFLGATFFLFVRNEILRFPQKIFPVFYFSGGVFFFVRNDFKKK